MRWSLPLTVLFVAIRTFIPTTVSAATITVNSTADTTTAGDGQCTLREAIANVDASGDTTGGDCTAGTGSGDSIVFTLRLPATITLKLGELDVEQSVAIVGPTMGQLRVSGHQSRVFAILAGPTSISNLIIQHGGTPGGPGNEGRGGGIYNTADLMLSGCVVTRNKAGFRGGGVYNEAGTLTVDGCTISGNRTTSGAGGAGGGLYNSSGTVTLTNSTVSGNKVRMHESNGGGVANDAGAAGSLTLTNCTLVANRSGGVGGAFANLTGSTALTNCTVSGNTASFGGGIIGYGGSATTVLNTIVAANHGHNCVSGSPVVATQGHNLDDDGTCFTTGGSDLVDTDALLPTLANYGGPTATLPPCTAYRVPSVSCRGRSPAIDAGDDAVLGPPDNLATDQRGLPRLAGAHVDIGADEAQQ